ncbi:SMP-30/gluconolactonase/LRE family protein [Pseudonocardia sp. RS11V-5]|uniref:SMP-30/gluconolactonase/LRE family protein n=1 Tax=Pseudonocardia terrae TaxID=2905831 RepID=UPI001E4C0D6D|nr:SMP-30/gluconolactonase/LRE family protein [Pseudonocardia terrae]MCE3551404.1 SMP-30/gluconolactonase/LRE family protein [Pseudonocardia terrae]
MAPDSPGGGLGPVIGPEPTYEILDPAFGACVDPVSWLERLSGGHRWTEGPAYYADLRCLVFSDIPNQKLLRYDEESGAVSVLRASTGHANGNTRDRRGRLVTCEQGARRVVRTEPDGSTTVLADSYRGRRLNSPNDVVVKSDGTIWFTDPSYGIMSDYVGNRAEQEQDTNNVYRIDPDGTITAVADDVVMPNGLAFSPDESLLYVADSAFLTDASAPRHLRRFAVDADNGLADRGVLAEVEPGIPDGFRADTDGRLWVGAGDGVQCFTPDGELIGKIRVPEATANLAFGGPKRNRLYITATSSLYAIYLNVTGAQSP